MKEYEDNNKMIDKKEEIIKLMTNTEYYPVFLEDEIGKDKYLKVPYLELLALGTAFEPLKTTFQEITKASGGKSGLYRVEVPNGMSLAKFNKKSGYLGSALKENNQIGGQAVLNPVLFNPTMLFMAGTVIIINRKFDEIQEIQQEIFDFLIQKERSELRGDLKFLSDVLSNHKYNWDNEKYKNSNYIKTLDIRQTAESKIDFYRERIKSKINKKSLLQTEQLVKRQLEKVELEFKDYQLALYIYGFSSFLEVMLLENFNSDYLNGISKKIESYSFHYRELYTKSYNEIEGNAKSSIQSQLVNKLATANKFIGETISKASAIKNSEIDEKLIETGNKLGEYSINRIEDTMNQFIENQNSYVYPFIENINEINRLYNQPIELVFDKENIYLGIAED